MKTLLSSLLILGALSVQAQNVTPPRSVERAASQLETLKEATQAIVLKEREGKVKIKTKISTETRPDINRYLVSSADDFLRTLLTQPTRQAYLQCIDKGLSSLGPLAPSAAERQEIALYYQDLMEIVGLDSSEGKLVAFVNTPD